MSAISGMLALASMVARYRHQDAVVCGDNELRDEAMLMDIVSQCTVDGSATKCHHDHLFWQVLPQ